jgi:hypothetical protein
MFARIIQIDSINGRAYQERGIYLISMNRIEEGCKDLRKAKELGFGSDQWLEFNCK